MVKDKSNKARNGDVKQNAPAKPPVGKKDMKTQTSRDFSSQITRAELTTEMADIEGLKMKGLITEHNGFKVRRPRPQKRDVMTMTSRDVSTQIKKVTLLAVRQEVIQRGESQIGPLVVAFKPKKRRPKYQRPRPPQRSIKTQTSRDFSNQVTAVEIKEAIEQAGEIRAVPNEYETTALTVNAQPAENGDADVISEEWTLEIVDDAGMNATIVQDDEPELLIQNAVTTETNGVDNPAFSEENTPENNAVNQVSTEMASLAVNTEGDGDTDEEYSTYL